MRVFVLLAVTFGILLLLCSCGMALLPVELQNTAQYELVRLPFMSYIHNNGTSVFGIAYSPEGGGTIYMSSLSPAVSGIIAYSLVNHTSVWLMGRPGENMCNNTGEYIPLGLDYPITPRGIDLINRNNLLFADGMPSSRIFLLQTPMQWQPFTRENMILTQVAGGDCNFTQSYAVNNSRTSSLESLIEPPTYVKYRRSAAQLYFSQNTHISIAEKDVTRLWFGTNFAGLPAESPMSNTPLFRTETRSAGVGQMDIMDDETMFVAEGGLATVRAISLSTGLATYVMGQALAGVKWPPINCTLAVPCTSLTAVLLYPQGIASWRHPLTGRPYLFVGDVTEAVIFRVDLMVDLIVIIAGEVLHSGAVTGPPEFSRVSRLRSLSVSRDALFITLGSRNALGAMRLTETARTSENATDAPYQPACDIITHCSGRATAVTGLPAVRCNCTCRYGWTTANCGERESWNAETRTVTIKLPDPIPAPIPVTLKKSAETTVVVSTVVAGAITSPTAATQASRATLLLRIAKCEEEFDTALDITQNLLQASWGKSNLRFYAGAVVGHLSLLGFAIFVHVSIAYIYAKQKGHTMKQGLATMRFPSVYTFPVMLFIEGTAMSSTTLFLHGQDSDLVYIGIVGMAACALVVIIVVYYLGFHFHATFVEYGHPAVSESLWNRFVHRLMHGKGKWTDEEGYWYRRRFGSLFMDYRPKRHAFIVAEIMMSILCGAVDAVRPGPASWACFAVLIALMLLYVLFFLTVIYFRPHVTRFDLLFSATVAGLQAGASVMLVLLKITANGQWETASNSFTLASIYLVSIKSFFDVFDTVKKVVYFLYKKLWLRIDVRWEARGETDAESEANQSMTNLNTVLSQQRRLQSPLLELEVTRPSPLLNPGELDHPPQQSQPTEINNNSMAAALDAILQNASFSSQAAAANRGPRELLEHEKMRMELESMLETSKTPNVGEIQAKVEAFVKEQQERVHAADNAEAAAPLAEELEYIQNLQSAIAARVTGDYSGLAAPHPSNPPSANTLTPPVLGPARSSSSLLDTLAEMGKQPSQESGGSGGTAKGSGGSGGKGSGGSKGSKGSGGATGLQPTVPVTCGSAGGSSGKSNSNNTPPSLTEQDAGGLFPGATAVNVPPKVPQQHHHRHRAGSGSSSANTSLRNSFASPMPNATGTFKDNGSLSRQCSTESQTFRRNKKNVSKDA